MREVARSIVMVDRHVVTAFFTQNDSYGNIMKFGTFCVCVCVCVCVYIYRVFHNFRA